MSSSATLLKMNDVYELRIYDICKIKNKKTFYPEKCIKKCFWGMIKMCAYIYSVCEELFYFYYYYLMATLDIFIIIKFKLENAIVTNTNSFQNQENLKSTLII